MIKTNDLPCLQEAQGRNLPRVPCPLHHPGTRNNIRTRTLVEMRL